LKGHLSVLAVILAALALTAAFPGCFLAVLAFFPSRRASRRIFSSEATSHSTMTAWK
jgi:hypothetical protein